MIVSYFVVFDRKNSLFGQALANAGYRVITDLEFKDELIRKGLKRAKEFSWGKTARETLRVFEEVYKSD